MAILVATSGESCHRHRQIKHLLSQSSHHHLRRRHFSLQWTMLVNKQTFVLVSFSKKLSVDSTYPSSYHLISPLRFYSKFLKRDALIPFSVHPGFCSHIPLKLALTRWREDFLPNPMVSSQSPSNFPSWRPLKQSAAHFFLPETLHTAYGKPDFLRFPAPSRAAPSQCLFSSTSYPSLSTVVPRAQFWDFLSLSSLLMGPCLPPPFT